MENYKKRIEEMIKTSKVFIFMKGDPSNPMCRFSRVAVDILKKSGAQELGFFDVLEDEGMRQAIKEFTGWPTLPQVFINGEFVGGADILIEMGSEVLQEKISGFSE